MSEHGTNGAVPIDVMAVTKQARARQVRDRTWVEAARQGDTSAFGQLYDEWVDHVYDRAVGAGASAAEARAITEDTFLSVWLDLDRLKQPGAFGAKVLQVTRRETSARVPADRRIAHLSWLTTASSATNPPGRSTGPTAEERLRAATDAVDVAHDHDVAGLVRDTMLVLGERTGDILDLHARHGLTSNETAAVLDLEPEKVAVTLAKLPLALRVLVRARLLWRSGDPDDSDLAEALRTKQLTTFNAEAVRTIVGFAREHGAARAASVIEVSPLDLYAAIPLANTPAGLKTAVASALMGHTVPMDGSVSVKSSNQGDLGEDSRADLSGFVPVAAQARSISELPAPVAETEQESEQESEQAEELALAGDAEPATEADVEPVADDATDATDIAEMSGAIEAEVAEADVLEAEPAEPDVATEGDAVDVSAVEEIETPASDETDAADDASPMAETVVDDDTGSATATAPADAAEDDEPEPGTTALGTSTVPEAAAEGKTSRRRRKRNAKVVAGTAGAAAVLTAAGSAAALDGAGAAAAAEPEGASESGTTDAELDAPADEAIQPSQAPAATADAPADAALDDPAEMDASAVSPDETEAIAAAEAPELVEMDEHIEQHEVEAITAADEADGAQTVEAEIATVPAGSFVDEDRAERSGRRVLVGAGLVAVLVIALISFALARSRDAQGSAALNAAAQQTTSTARPSTTIAPPTTPVPTTAVVTTSASTSTSTPATTTAPTTATTRAPTVAPTTTVFRPPTTVPPPTTTTTSQSQSIATTMAMSSTNESATYGMANAPVLTWSVTGNLGVSVTVTGPGISPNYSRSGREVLCPGVISNNVCTTQPGDYQYTLVVHPSDGSPDRFEVRGLHIQA